MEFETSLLFHWDGTSTCEGIPFLNTDQRESRQQKVKLSYAPTSMSSFIMFELEVAEKEKKTSFLFYGELNHLTFLRIKGKSCRE